MTADPIPLSLPTTTASLLLLLLPPGNPCCHESDTRALAQCVRLPFLGPSYLSFVVMQHDWFNSSIDPVSLTRAIAYAAASSTVKSDLAQHAAAVQDSASASSSSSASGSNSNSGGTCGAGSSAHSIMSSSFRSRASSAARSCTFTWPVDLASVCQLYDEVAAAGSRASRTLRSPAHAFAGYEWSLQVEITQTRGATGFDGSKPWALGVFLTCQVRSEAMSETGGAQAGGASSSTGSSSTGTKAVVNKVVGAAGSDVGTGNPISLGGSDSAGAGSDESTDHVQGARRSSLGVGINTSTTSSTQQQLQQQQQQHQPLQFPALHQVDFGFVSTAATISAREGGSKDKRWEKSWEHAVVRHRASWGWPNYLDVLCNGWNDAHFDRWVTDGQLQLQCTVRVLG